MAAQLLGMCDFITFLKSVELKDAVHYLSELEGSYDAETLCCACWHLAETIKRGREIIEL